MGNERKWNLFFWPTLPVVINVWVTYSLHSFIFCFGSDSESQESHSNQIRYTKPVSKVRCTEPRPQIASPARHGRPVFVQVAPTDRHPVSWAKSVVSMQTEQVLCKPQDFDREIQIRNSSLTEYLLLTNHMYRPRRWLRWWRMNLVEFLFYLPGYHQGIFVLFPFPPFLLIFQVDDFCFYLFHWDVLKKITRLAWNSCNNEFSKLKRRERKSEKHQNILTFFNRQWGTRRA